MTEAAVGRTREAGRALSAFLSRFGSAAAGWPLAVGAICFTLTAARLPTTADSYLDLVVGRWILAHGIPHVDSLTVAGSGRTWVDQQWLAQVLMYGTWRVAGPVGLGFLLALLLAATYALLTRLCIRLGAPPQRAARWALLAFLGSAGYAAIRAEMFSYLAFVLVLTCLVRDTQRREFERSFLWVFAILAVWANIHGAVVLGALLVVAYCVGRAAGALVARRGRSAGLYAASAVVSAACLFTTPYGFSAARYYHGVFSSSILRQYENEWTSPRLSYLFNWMTFVFVIASAVTVALAVRRGCRPNPVLLLAAAFTGALAFDAIRYQPWFALSGAALVSVTMGRIRPAPAALDSRFLRLGAAALALVALVSTVSAARAQQNPRETALARGALAAAAHWASAHPQARILADEKTSDRLLWWHPATVGRVALDGRLDFYDPDSVHVWFSYILGPGVPRSLGGKRFGTYLASASNRPLYAKLRDDPCLRTIFADRYGIVAVRETTNRDCGTGSS